MFFNRTMLAQDFDERKTKFPVIVQPKIDGVRGLYPDDRGLLARSLKYHGNRHTRAFFSNQFFFGLDGELAAERETHPDLCRITTSATSSHDGEPWLLWHVFDYLHPSWIDKPYIERLEKLHEHVSQLKVLQPLLGIHLQAIPYKVVNNFEELYAFEKDCVDAGYEGVCFRDPKGLYKNGRSTATKGELMRIKRFKVDDAVVVGFEEAMENRNVAFLNERGYTTRSTHQENMVPKGMVGAVLLQKPDGTKFKVGPGKMTEQERIEVWSNQTKYLGLTAKYKHFPHGVKDKPRLSTFECFRSPEDVL